MNVWLSASLKLCIIMQLDLVLPINSDPQLDLPPINIKARAKPEIYHNSYTVKVDTNDDDDEVGEVKGRNSNKQPDASDYDRDRSLRYGPPYYNNEEYDRYGYGHNQNRSYFSHDSQRINGDDDRYYSERDVPRDRPRTSDNNHGVYNDNNYRNGYQYGRVN